MSRNSNLGLGAVWEETVVFLKIEWALLLPVAGLSFGLAMLIPQLAMPENLPTDPDKMVLAPWMIAFLPAGLFSMFGSLAISALALHPGMSVGESLMLALSRMPAGLGLFFFFLGAQIALAIPLSIIGLIEIHNNGATGPGSLVTNFATLAVMIWLMVRALPVWALLAERPRGPWQAIVTSFRVTHGFYAKLLLLRIVGMVSGFLVMLVALTPFGVVIRLAGKLIGDPDVMKILLIVVSAAIFSILATVWTVYCARLYRRLAALAQSSRA